MGRLIDADIFYDNIVEGTDLGAEDNVDEALKRYLDLEPTVEAIPKDQINKAIEKIEQYICDVETDTVKAQGMAQALDMFEQTLGGLEMEMGESGD